MQHIHTHTHTPTGRRWQIEASKLLDRFPAPSPNVTENSLLLLLLLLALLLFLLFPPILYRRCCIHTPSYNVGKRKLENSFFYFFIFIFFQGEQQQKNELQKRKKERKAFPISECQPVLLLELSSSLLTPCWFRRPLAFKLISFPLPCSCRFFVWFSCLTLLVIFRAQKQSLNVRCCVCLGSDLRNERVIQSSIQRKRKKKKTLEKESRITENMKGFFLCVLIGALDYRVSCLSLVKFWLFVG